MTERETHFSILGEISMKKFCFVFVCLLAFGATATAGSASAGQVPSGSATLATAGNVPDDFEWD
ncbi:hypothetical protein ACIQ6K_14245 [Streptomyces sp. NPDC096354]|uniref:hypothetical protein n=1 Tax=Streptomyces sp. NPDC096354 TaxID=3366088 RepID=UPI00382290AE